jgi:hypothetical protein
MPFGLYAPSPPPAAASGWQHHHFPAALSATVLAIAPSHHQQHQHPRQQRGGAAQRVPGSGTGKSFVLRVVDLPLHVTPDDVARLFDGLEMLGDGVHLVPGLDGSHCCGDAFVEFTSEAWAKKALALSPIRYASATVTVVRSSIAELTATLYPAPHEPPELLDADRRPRPLSVPACSAAVTPSASSAAAIVDAVGAASAEAGSEAVKGEDVTQVARVTGLKPGTSREAVEELFRGFQVSENGVFLGTGHGDAVVAYLAFRSARERDRAVSRFGASAEDVAGGDLVVSRAEEPPAGDDGITGCVLRLSDLPSHCGYADIVEFFNGLEIADGGFVQSADAGDRSAWVRFVSAEQTKYAKVHMAHRLLDGHKIRSLAA